MAVASSGAIRKFLLAIIFILLLAAAGIFAVGPLQWRAIILFDRATGRLNDLNWSDVHWALGRGTGVDLERLAATRNPYESIESPRMPPRGIPTSRSKARGDLRLILKPGRSCFASSAAPAMEKREWGDPAVLRCGIACSAMAAATGRFSAPSLSGFQERRWLAELCRAKIPGGWLPT